MAKPKGPSRFVPEAERPRAGTPQVRLFRGDEMSSGQSNSLRNKARQVIGSSKTATPVAPNRPLPPSDNPTRREISSRARQAELAAENATRPGSAAARAKSSGARTGDTFIRRKMKQAEKNLPEWDPDDETQR